MLLAMFEYSAVMIDLIFDEIPTILLNLYSKKKCISKLRKYNSRVKNSAQVGIVFDDAHRMLNLS